MKDPWDPWDGLHFQNRNGLRFLRIDEMISWCSEVGASGKREFDRDPCCSQLPLILDVQRYMIAAR